MLNLFDLSKSSVHQLHEKLPFVKHPATDIFLLFFVTAFLVGCRSHFYFWQRVSL